MAWMRSAAAGVLSLSVLWVTGCEKGDQAKGAAPPPPAVTVARPAQREVIEWDDYTGNLAAPDAVELHARVSGLLVEANFAEGQVVQKDQVLFQIDVRPYQAALDAKKASLAQAEATLALNQVTLRRYANAAPGSAVSQQEYDVAKANVQQADAVVQGAKADVETAQLNVDWCKVTAPITGRVGRKEITPGNIVTAAGATGAGTLLTTINSIDPIYLYVTVDERSMLKYSRLAEENKRVSARDAKIPCFMQLLNEQGFPHQGVVDFVDNHVDPQTGTLRARGVYPNPKGIMQPGSFGRTRIPGSGRYTATLIPDAAIGTDQNIKYVLTVGPDDVVKSHVVKPGALFGTLRAIEEGVGPDERVIVNGLMKVRPGIKVTARETALDLSSMQLTSPGSPTTQALPATRPFNSPAPTTAAADVAAARPSAATTPTTAPTTTVPTTRGTP